MVEALGNPPIETPTWYDAPPPGARCRFSCAQVSTLDRVRSQTTGSLLTTVDPAVRVAIMLLGFSWQSVERHHTSEPLETVNTCMLDPTSIVQSWSPLLVSEIESFGETPAAYDSASVTAFTSTSFASHATTAGVASADGDGDGEGDGDPEGVGVPVADDVGAGPGSSPPVAAHGRATRSQTAAPMIASTRVSPSSAASRRRRYTAAE